MTEEKQEVLSQVVILKPLIEEADVSLLENIVCVDANKEYNFLIGECKKFFVKARGGAVKVAFSKGQSALKYILLADGISYNEDLIHPISIEIYFQSEAGGTVLEIVKWL